MGVSIPSQCHNPLLQAIFEHNGVHDVNPLYTADPTFGEFRRSFDAEIKCL